MLPNIEIRPMRLEDEEAARNLYASGYMAREPLERALRVDPEKGAMAWFHKMFPQWLDENLSVVATDLDTGNLIGGCCVGILCKGKADTMKFSKDDPTVRGIALTYEAVGKAYSGINIYEKYGVEKYANLRKVDVSENYCKRGIGSRMLEKALEQIRKANISLVTIETSSAFARMICEKLEFDKLSEIFYEDMVLDGEKLVMTDDLKFHKSFCAWAKELC